MLFKKKDKYLGFDRRHFWRHKIILPVEFGQVDASNEQKKVFWHQGYTGNLSENGLCLETVNMGKESLTRFDRESSMLLVKILYPLKGIEINGLCHKRWMKKETMQWCEKYYFGLEFHQIDKQGLAILLKELNWSIFSSRIFLILTIIFLFGFIGAIVLFLM